MAGKTISSCAEVDSASSVKDYKVPCSTGDGTAKTITIANLLSYCASVLGITSISEFSTSKQYVAGKSGDGYCIYNNDLYRFTSPHIGPWDDSDAEKTSLYNELLNFYSQTFEAVTVHVSVADGGFDVSGLEVGLKLDDGTTSRYTTGSDGTVTFNVEKGMNYTLSMTGKSGYLTVSDKTFRAQNNARDVYFVYNPTSSAENMETVNVYPGTTNSSYTILSGALLTVVAAGVTSQYTFDSTHNRWQFTVPHGSDYTITMPTVSSYILLDRNTLAFSSSLTERAVYGGTYYYVGGEGIFYTLSDGTDKAVSAYDADSIGSIKDSVQFIHIATANLLAAQSSRTSSAKCDFYIKISQATAGKKWRSANSRFNSLTNISSTATAKTDFDGYNNTAAIRAELNGLGETQDSNYVLTYLDSLAAVTNFEGTTLTPFILSLGQFWELIQVFTTYQTAYKLLGLTAHALNSGTWWCSTQHSDTLMWVMGYGSPGNVNKTYGYTVLPVYAY